MSFDGLNPDVPRLPAGLIATRTPYGIVQLPPSSRVAAYVRGTAGTLLQVNGDPEFVNANLVATLAAGLARCRSGAGDAVVVLPGHTENVTTATDLSANLVADTKIVGLGRGASMPTFTWTLAAGQWLLNKANLEISGLRLALTGADEITKAINITSAADGIMYGCDIIVASGASNNAAIAIEFGTACDRFEFTRNRVRGSVAGPPTNLMLVAGVSDGLRITDNDIAAAVSVVSVGCINITAAATGLRILRNNIHHRLASSETGISAGAVACEGIVANNYISVEAGGISDYIELNAASLLRCFENYATDTKNTSGILAPAVVTP